MKTLLPIVFLFTALSSAPSQASQSYNLSYSPNATDTITGSFSGTANGDIITNLTDISMFYKGIGFGGNPRSVVAGCCWLPDGYTYIWGTHFAQISFSGGSNNFAFGSYSTIEFSMANGQISIDGLAIGSVNINSAPNPSNWTVTAVKDVTAVPLPGGIFLFASGLGLLSIARRKISAKN